MTLELYMTTQLLLISAVASGEIFLMLLNMAGNFLPRQIGGL